jgi:hypothetical protein
MRPNHVNVGLIELSAILAAATLVPPLQSQSLVVNAFAEHQGVDLPYCMVWDPDHRLLVVDRTNSRIVVLSENGERLQQIGAAGQGEDELLYPAGLALAAADRTLSVLDSGNKRVQIFSR